MEHPSGDSLILQPTHLIKMMRRGETEIREYDPENFQTVAGHKYLRELQFDHQKTLQRIRKQCARALEGGFISAQNKWLGTLHADEIRNHSIADVSIRWIDETLGYGLFADKDLKAGEFIGEYTGVVRRLRYFIFKNYNEYCFSYPTSDLNSRKHIVDGKDQGNELRYANHSEDPNCESIGVLFDGILHIIVRAIKDIPANKQITYSYADWYWQSRTPLPNVP